jgi:Spy/CpxP family protein refolding chaperone
MSIKQTSKMSFKVLSGALIFSAAVMAQSVQAQGGATNTATNSPAAPAASTNNPATPPVTRPVRPRGIDGRVDQYAKRLDLNADQKAKFKTLLQDNQDKVLALRRDKTVTPEDRRAKTAELRKTLNANLRLVLTEAQAVKFDAMTAPRTRPPQ